MVVRILVIAADPLARAGLSTMLASLEGLEVVGRSDGGDWNADVEAYEPDVIVLDAGWQGAGDWDRRTETVEGLPVLLLLGDESGAAAAWTAGVRGLLPRNVTGEVLAAAVVALDAGLAVVDPQLAHLLRGAPLPFDALPPPTSSSLPEPLTPRELQVLRLMADGLPNKTIASRLQISEHTVKFHVNSLLGKLGAASRTEAVVTATRLGLILL